MKSERRSQKGFSLIELIIAIAILVILTGLLAPQFMKYIERSREAKDLQTLDTIYEGVQAALTNEKAYKAVEGITSLENGESINTILANASSDDFATELKNVLGASSFELLSQRAIKVEGKIFISVSQNMEVGVFYGTQKTEGAQPHYVPGLCVGTMPPYADPGT